MDFSGIIVGAAVFLSIGICHPVVIKMEYYWGKRSWCAIPLFPPFLAALPFPVSGLFTRCFYRRSVSSEDGSRRTLRGTFITRILEKSKNNTTLCKRPINARTMVRTAMLTIIRYHTRGRPPREISLPKMPVQPARNTAVWSRISVLVSLLLNA